jgi:phage/plasmid-like protein (TIGR03299 family)
MLAGIRDVVRWNLSPEDKHLIFPFGRRLGTPGLSTTAKFTSIRVVCHNTLTMSTGYAGEGQSEKDSAGSCIRIPHSAKFDAKDVRLDLGIVFDEWERFLATTRKLARTAVDDTFAREFLKQLLPTPTTVITGKVARPVEETKAFKSIIGLFEGCAIGAGLPEAKGTAYGLLNAVTEYVDHQRGGDETRLSSVWFGGGEGLKNEAFALLEKIAA